MTTFLFNMIVIVAAGWMVFALDRQFGKKWYRKWYDISHEKPLPPDRERGFIFGRTGRAKCWMAGFLSFIATFILAKLGGMSHLAFLFTFLLGIFAMLVAFVTAPYILNLWSRRTKIYETIDGIDRGEIDPGKRAKETSARMYGRVINAIRSISRQIFDDRQATVPPIEKSVAENPAETGCPEIVPSPEDKINKFTRGQS